jgi:hypothetical protein
MALGWVYSLPLCTRPELLFPFPNSILDLQLGGGLYKSGQHLRKVASTRF